MSIVQNDTSPIAFDMVDATTGDPAPGNLGTLAGQWKKKGGVLAGCAGAFAESGDGGYEYTPAAGEVDTLGDITFIPTATGCKTIVRGERVVAAGAAASDWSSARAAKVDNLDVASSTLATATSLAAAKTVMDAVKAKTDNLPSDPADESLIIAATDAIQTAIGGIAAGSGLDAAGVRAAIGLAAANLDAQLAAVPTAVENADALLARNQKGGADGPAEESVSAALAGGFFLFSGGDTATITINNGDGTPAFTRTLSRDLTKLLGAIIAASA